MAQTNPHPLDALWQPQAIIWVLLAGECLAAVLALAPGDNGGRWIYFGLASFLIQWVALLTLGSLYMFRRLLVGVRPPHVAWLALALLLVNTWLVTGLAWLLIGTSWPAAEDGWLALMLQLTGIVVAVGLLGLAAFQNHWHARQLAVRAKQSELEALQARIRPHFLFNTLNSGVALVRQQPEQAEQLLLGLSDLFRAALANPHDIELAEELALTQRYLEIEAIRFGPRLQTTWDLPEPLPSVMVPALSIQPLVENAVRHGIERLPGGGRIDIAVAVRDNAAVVTIRNRTPAGDLDGTARHGHSIGIKATQARLQASTGGRGSLITSQSDGDYVVEMRLPL